MDHDDTDSNAKADGAVRLRRGVGAALALEWNAPLLLLFWFPWSVVHLVLVANCLLWAGGIWLMGASDRCRAILFEARVEGAPPRWTVGALTMLALGSAAMLAWFLEPQ